MASSADLVIRVLADTSSADTALSKLGGNLTKALGIGAAGGIAAAALQASIDTESALARIQAVYNNVDFAPGTAKYQAAKDFILKTSTELATSADDLATVYAQGARLIDQYGNRLPTDKVEEFTDATARMAKVSSDGATAEQLGQQVGVLEELYNNATNYKEVASAIVDLSTKHNLGEGTLIASATAIGQVGAGMGVSQGQALGLGNYLSSFGQGIGGQVGGSAIGRMLLNLTKAADAELDPESKYSDLKKHRDASERLDDLQTQLKEAEQRRSQMYGQHGLKTQYKRDPAAVTEADDRIAKLQREIADQQADNAHLDDGTSRGGLNLAEMAKTAGVDAGSFAQEFKNDPITALLHYASGLHALSEDQRSSAEARAGFKNVRDLKVIDALATNPDLAASFIGEANDQLNNPTALGGQSGDILGTTASREANAANAVHAAGALLADPAREELSKGLQAILDGVQKDGFTPLEDKLHDASQLYDAANGALGTFIQQIGVAGGLQLAAASIGAGKALAGAAGAAGGGASGVNGAATGAGTPGPVGVGNFLGAGASAGLGVLATALGGELEKQVEGILHDKGLTGVDAKGATGAAQVQIGDITVHAANPLQDILAAVTQKITESWNAAQSGHVVSGQVGGNYTTGQAPH